MKPFEYCGEKLREIVFPIGGIGTGCIGLAGNGRLMDWEIFNRPDKNSTNGYSFFAIKAEQHGQVHGPLVLQGDYEKNYMGEGQGNNRFGSGVNRETMAGFPHFDNVCFTGKFPVAELDYRDDTFPLDVRMTVFNPFIPLNEKDSSIPGGIFSFLVTNHTQEVAEVTLLGNVYNSHQKQSVNRYFEETGHKGIVYTSEAWAAAAPEYAQIALCTDCEEVSKQTYLYRGRWFDAMTLLWEEFSKQGPLQDRVYANPYDDNSGNLAFVLRDAGALALHGRLAPGESKEFRFVITWYVPNFVNYWNPGAGKEPAQYPTWKNYYATQFSSAQEVARYLLQEYGRLKRETLLFRDSLFSSTLPSYVLDAVSANMSTLKTPTCLRLTDGTFYGFEGCHAQWESCEGSCTHVWGYDQTTPFLFPALSRSMHNIHYRYCGDENGKYYFRMMLPPESTGVVRPNHNGPNRAAADGQMVNILRVYRDWKLCGDTEWLKQLWPAVGASLAYAWSKKNEYGWDGDHDGIMEGRQHQTLDVELYGPNAFISGIYQAALLAAVQMAQALGEPWQEYQSLFEKGNPVLNTALFNGEYYEQKIDIRSAASYPFDAEIGEIKNQIGSGCFINQIIGQWHATLYNLPRVFEREKAHSALQAVYRYNFVRLGKYANPCRVFALNGEKGVVVCTWPRGNKPRVPVPYSGECMYGMEYETACQMLCEGMLEQGLELVRECRARFDGRNRNPWNEYESGSHYARSLSAYSLLLALSGFRFDLIAKRIGFSPLIHKNNFQCFWSIGTGWGQYIQKERMVRLEVAYGSVELNGLELPEELFGGRVAKIEWEGHLLEFTEESGSIAFLVPLELATGQSVRITACQ